MEENEINNESLIPINNDLVRVENSITITNKLIGEINYSKFKWWDLLEPEWKNIFYNQGAYKKAHNCFEPDYKQKDIPSNLNELELNEILNLETLYCDKSTITDFTPISRLTKLKYLFLNHTSLDSLKKIEFIIPNLLSIELNSTKINSISLLKSADNLEQLSIYHCLINNLTPLADVKTLKNLYLSTSEEKIFMESVIGKKVDHYGFSKTEIQEFKKHNPLCIVINANGDKI